jgi:2-aminoadipate transaminase
MHMHDHMLLRLLYHCLLLHAAQQVPVPMSERGIDVSALAKLLCAPGAPRPTLAYLVPVHHNPCGVTLSTPDRETLLALAHEHGFTVLADEVYQLLSFPGAPPPPPPLRAVEQRMLQCGRLLPAAPSGCMQASSRVVSLGSFSKILAPGTRLGWMEADTVTLRRVRRDGVLCSGGGVAPLASGIVHSCIELGLLQHHLHDVVIPALSERCAALCDELRQRLPDVRFVQPFGGYFVWLQLPQHVCAEELQQFAAAQHGVLFVAGSACGGERNTLRLSFAFYPPEELREGVRRLAAALEDYIGQKTS